MDAWLEWARGPCFRAALIFMILGLIRHVAVTLWEMGRVLHRAGDRTLPGRKLAAATFAWLFPPGRLKDRLLFGLTTFAYHVAIVLVPLFLAGHVALWRAALGFGWPALPNAAADVLTLVALATAVLLVVQRAAAPDARRLSRLPDHLIHLVIAIPFASGYLAMHPAVNPFPYEATLLVHVLSANLLLVLIPLTKLSHCTLLPGMQLASELAWHWPRDAGSRVGAALGKEGERI
jgi:nitrate reductase gamma subunit